MGDFNAPDISWLTLCASSAFSKLLCDFAFDNNLTQLVDKPTHIHGNILDLVFTNDNERIAVMPSEIIPFATDHFPVSIRIKTHSIASVSSPKFVYNYNKADLEGLCSYLLDSDFSTCFMFNDVNLVWSEIIIDALPLYIPQVRIRSYQRPKWVTPLLQHKYNCLRSSKKKCKNPSAAKLSRISQSEQMLLSELSSAKSEYESRLIQDFAFKKNYKIFSHLKNLTGGDKIPPIVNFESVSASTDYERASIVLSFCFQ